MVFQPGGFGVRKCGWKPMGSAKLRHAHGNQVWIDESGYSCSVRTERKNGHIKTTKGMLKYDSHLAINFPEKKNKSLGWYSLNAHSLVAWWAGDGPQMRMDLPPTTGLVFLLYLFVSYYSSACNSKPYPDVSHFASSRNMHFVREMMPQTFWKKLLLFSVILNQWKSECWHVNVSNHFLKLDSLTFSLSASVMTIFTTSTFAKIANLDLFRSLWKIDVGPQLLPADQEGWP